MTFRYNPQSIEKQVRKWPVLFSEKDLKLDLILRLKQQLDLAEKGWADPFSVCLPLNQEYLSEYGIDASRTAVIASSSVIQAESLLETYFKWLSKLYTALSKPRQISFNPVPWLEAVIQASDHILKRGKSYLALALIMKASKKSPLSQDLTEQEKTLVATALYPFAPVFAAKALIGKPEVFSIKEIQKLFNAYYCTKIALENGGWHWQVFSRRMFEGDPILELKKIKWINKASFGKELKIRNEGEGIRICFS